MKKLTFIAVSLLTINASLFAGNVSDSLVSEPQKVQAGKQPFHSVVVNNDIDLVLAEDTDNMIKIRGVEKHLKNVCYSIKKGVLYISSNGGSLKNKATVYLSVNDLQSLVVNGKSAINSKGTLNSKQLTVLVNGEAKFDLKNYGAIIMEAGNEIELDIEEKK
jgi:hypothetical protein